jgi:hypothetical protein
MKNHFFLFVFILTSVSQLGYSQSIKDSKALVIGQFDRPDERYAIEVTLTELLSSNGLESMPSLNVLKQGSDPSVLANDSIQSMLLKNNISTYLIVNVRGYDRRFKPSKTEVSLREMLSRTSIYHIYREEATSVSFEFTFFQKNKVVFRDILRCRNISDRDSVIKRIRKKLPKRIARKWFKS